MTYSTFNNIYYNFYNEFSDENPNDSNQMSFIFAIHDKNFDLAEFVFNRYNDNRMLISASLSIFMHYGKHNSVKYLVNNYSEYIDLTTQYINRCNIIYQIAVKFKYFKYFTKYFYQDIIENIHDILQIAIDNSVIEIISYIFTNFDIDFDDRLKKIIFTKSYINNISLMLNICNNKILEWITSDNIQNMFSTDYLDFEEVKNVLNIFLSRPDLVTHDIIISVLQFMQYDQYIYVLNFFQTSYPDLFSNLNIYDLLTTCYYLDIDIFEYLVKMIEDFDINYDDGIIFYYACRNNNYIIIEYILETFPDFDINARNGKCFKYLITQYHYDFFKKIVSEYNVYIKWEYVMINDKIDDKYKQKIKKLIN